MPAWIWTADALGYLLVAAFFVIGLGGMGMVLVCAACDAWRARCKRPAKPVAVKGPSYKASDRPNNGERAMVFVEVEYQDGQWWPLCEVCKHAVRRTYICTGCVTGEVSD